MSNNDFSSNLFASPFRKDCLEGKVALVTGGASGICYEIVLQMLQHGLKGAVICGRRQDFLKRSTAMLNQTVGRQACYWIVCDVRKPDLCQQAVEYTVTTLDHLDILINGAAGNFLSTASSLSPKGFATVLSIDTMGTFNMCHAAYPALLKTRRGEQQSTTAIIINISATLQYGATWYQVHASAAKAAVDSLTRSLALEWGKANLQNSRGIRVVGIAPGGTADTPGTTKLAPGFSPEQVQELLAESIPLGRLGEKYEMAMAAIFLCTAEYITGDTIVVDGGEWLYRPPLVPQDMVAELSRKVEAESRALAPKAKL